MTGLVWNLIRFPDLLAIKYRHLDTFSNTVADIFKHFAHHFKKTDATLLLISLNLLLRKIC